MDLSKYYSDYQEALKMREVLKEFNEYIKLADYSYELFRSNYREIINSKMNKTRKIDIYQANWGYCEELSDVSVNKLKALEKASE